MAPSSFTVAVLATTALVAWSATTTTTTLPSFMVAMAFSHPLSSSRASPAATFGAFSPSSRSSSVQLLRRWASPESDGGDEVRRLGEKARRYRLEAERLTLSLGLEKIDALEVEIEKVRRKPEGSGEASSKKESQVEEWMRRVKELVRASVEKDEAEEILSGLLQTEPTSSIPLSSFPPPSGPDNQERLSKEELKAATAYVRSLPIPARDALARVAEYREGFDSVDDVEKMIQELYEKRRSISTATLRRMYFESFAIQLDGGSVESMERITSRKNGRTSESLIERIDQTIEELDQNKTFSMELFPGPVKKADEIEGQAIPSGDDADVVFRLLDRTTFMATERPIKVQGGYMILGENKRKSASELLSVVDEKLSKERPSWTDDFQVSYVEVPVDGEMTSIELSNQVLLLTSNKFKPAASEWFNLVSVFSLGLSVVYCIDTFGKNEAVVGRLKEAAESVSNAAAGASTVGLYDLTWFNDLLLPMLATIGVAQLAQELGHLAVAKANEIKITPPTILPSQALPYLSFQNRLKSSPKDYTALFDFAFAGPVAGLAVSFIALLVGLQLTTTVDSETARLLPSLPVSVLTQSSLGATIVDGILGGGDGILLSQDPSTPVPLHPVAVGGFFGLIVNALDLLPIGSTDGGRMSQAVFGRIFHLAFSSAVFFVLLVSTLVSDDLRILLGFLFISSFSQRDLEILCRNEIDTVELPRAAAAFVVWFVVVLILAPL